MAYTFILRPRGDMSVQQAPDAEAAAVRADELRARHIPFVAFNEGAEVFDQFEPTVLRRCVSAMQRLFPKLKPAAR